EARVARGAAAPGRALQPRQGPLGDDQRGGPEPSEGGGAAAAGRGAVSRKRGAAHPEGSAGGGGGDIGGGDLVARGRRAGPRAAALRFREGGTPKWPQNRSWSRHGTTRRRSTSSASTSPCSHRARRRKAMRSSSSEGPRAVARRPTVIPGTSP